MDVIGGDISIRSRREPFTVMGYWKFDRYESLVAGQLVYDGRGSLALHAMMPIEPRSPAHTRASKDPQFQQLSGVLETGESAILRLVHRTNSRTVSGTYSVTSSVYRVGRMLVGHRVSDTEAFDGISVQCTGLLEWLDQHPVTSSDGDPEAEAVFTHKLPEGPEIVLEDGTKLRAHYPRDSAYSLVQAAMFVIPQPVEMVMSFDSPVPLDKLHAKAMRFVRLLALAIGSYVPVTSIRVCVDPYFMGLFDQHADQDPAYTDFGNFNFLYTDIKDHFKEVAESWFDFYEKHDKGLDLYFETLKDEGRLIPEIVFLRIVQSLESLHRSDRPCGMSLADRLYALLETPHNVLGSANKGEFVRAVKATRHYHAHGHLEGLEGDLASGAALIRITSQLKLLMSVCMIDALAIPGDLKQKAADRELRRQILKMRVACSDLGEDPGECSDPGAW